jgi:phage major head subunit gpT-like protein
MAESATIEDFLKAQAEALAAAPDGDRQLATILARHLLVPEPATSAVADTLAEIIRLAETRVAESDPA